MEEINYIHEFVAADYCVMAGYLLMLVSIGFIVKKLCGNVKDYFIGGNRIPWWLSGASCFMMSFSAWTFTGAAGFAYQNGILICLIFYFSVVAYLFAGLFIAHKCRQTRQITFPQIIYGRFGRIGEQFLLWIQVPNMLFAGAMWMVGLGTFISAAFGIPITTTIIVCGVIILTYSTISGAWAVMTTDFVQALILMVLTSVIFVLTLGKIGGFEGFVNKVDSSKFVIFSGEHTWLWALAYMSQIFMTHTSVVTAPRYLAVRTGNDARKVAFVTAALFIIGPLIWFLPPIAASYFYPNIAEILPQLNHPQDASYVLIGLSVLPQGLAGLLVMVVFAATLSMMDSSVNQNAAIISLNLYKPLLRPNAGEKEMFIASRIFNVLCGVAVILGGLLLSKQGELALFDLMVFLMASLTLPVALPCFLLYWIKKTPHWSPVVSVALSLTYASITFLYDCSLHVRVFGTIAIGTSSFLACGLFWNRVSEHQKAAINDFYNKMNTPINPETEFVGSENVSHLRIVGTISIFIGIGLLSIVFFPNDLRGRVIITTTAATIFLAGVGMYVVGGLAQRKKNSHNNIKTGYKNNCHNK